MAMRVPLDSRQLVGDGLGFLVVDPYDVILARCGETLAIGGVINGHHEVALLCCSPYFLARFGDVLEYAAVSVGNQQDRVYGCQIFVVGTPPKTINWRDLFLARVGVDLAYFVVSVHVENAHLPVTISCGEQRILVTESAHHELSFFGQG